MAAGTYHTGAMSLVELIEAYGQECRWDGNRGYETDASYRLLEEIMNRIKMVEEDRGGALA